MRKYPAPLSKMAISTITKKRVTAAILDYLPGKVNPKTQSFIHSNDYPVFADFLRPAKSVPEGS